MGEVHLSLQAEVYASGNAHLRVKHFHFKFKSPIICLCFSFNNYEICLMNLAQVIHPNWNNFPKAELPPRKDMMITTILHESTWNHCHAFITTISHVKCNLGFFWWCESLMLRKTKAENNWHNNLLYGYGHQMYRTSPMV